MQIELGGICQDVQARLIDLDQKLQGVNNIVGHHIAVNDMAEMLGIHIPQVCMTSSQTAVLAALLLPDTWYA